MGKNNKKRKRTNHALFHAVKARMNNKEGNNGQNDPETLVVPVVATTTAPATTSITAATAITDPDGTVVVSESDLTTTLTTLQKLVAHPTLFHSKLCKDLRRTLHPLVLEQLQSYDKGIDYKAKVTHALSAGRWADALAALQACRDFQQVPKQGTIQRWVRDCTEAASAGCQMPLLQAILAVSPHAREAHNKHDPAQALAEHLSNQPRDKEDVTILEGWKWWEHNSSSGSNSDSDKAQQEGNDNEQDEKKDNKTQEEEHDSNNAENTLTLKSRIVYRENANERTPPNHYDLILHTSEPGSIQWTSTPPPTSFHSIPFLPEPARVLSNVLTVHECQQLRKHMTTLEYRPDHPVTLDAPTGIDSCEWMIDDAMAQTIFERVQPHLPATLTLPHHNHQNKKAKVQLHSINPRWRCFRYGQDCVYRPHLDGSWPQSYINPEDGSYCCPKQSNVKSYLTFLIYLNDDFEGGETRFYLPQGVARGIVPKVGCVAVFPQGNMASLIHEGSHVTRGTKYVVRTDVLYSPLAAVGNDGDNNDDVEAQGGGDGASIGPPARMEQDEDR